MNEHDAIRELLPLAAAGALDEREQRRVDEHLAACTVCAGELERWWALEQSLRRLPTPQAPALLVERTRMRIRAELLERAERTVNPWLMGFLVMFSWTLALATWPVLRWLGGGSSSGQFLGTDFGLDRSWLAFAGYTLAGWVVGGVAALAMAVRHVATRRTT
jgi:anti-sigma factor RsiW